MRLAITDIRVSDEIKRSLERQGFTVCSLPPCAKLGEAVRSHPDTLICRISKELILSADYCESWAYGLSDIREYFPSFKIHFGADALGPKYPEDTRYNALIIGKYIFCKVDSISEKVLEIADANGLVTVPVKQGYCGCTVLPLGDNAAITADEGMALAMEKVGIKVYRISQGGIRLYPHEYGFIGGASAVYRDNVYFFGDFKTHPSWEVIDSALKEQGYKAIGLAEGELFDFGGIIFLE